MTLRPTPVKVTCLCQRVTLSLVLFGGFESRIEWISGMWKLWSDPTSSRLQKMLATLIFPVVLPPTFMFAGSAGGTSTSTSGLIDPNHESKAIAS